MLLFSLCKSFYKQPRGFPHTSVIFNCLSGMLNGLLYLRHPYLILSSPISDLIGNYRICNYQSPNFLATFIFNCFLFDKELDFKFIWICKWWINSHYEIRLFSFSQIVKLNLVLIVGHKMGKQYSHKFSQFDHINLICDKFISTDQTPCQELTAWQLTWLLNDCRVNQILFKSKCKLMTKTQYFIGSSF